MDCIINCLCACAYAVTLTKGYAAGLIESLKLYESDNDVIKRGKKKLIKYYNSAGFLETLDA